MSDPILNLGRKLVVALKADDDDLLSQWMAHYIAELITECDIVDPAISKAAKERCAAAILELWSHRASLTGASKPFQDLALIMETLRALNPEAEQLFYRRMIPSSDGAANEETIKWLAFAKNCDAIARILISIGIEKAHEHAGNDASEWAEIASTAGLGYDLDIQISNFLAERLNEGTRPNERQVQVLKGRIEKLEVFSNMASALRTDLQKKIEALEDET